MDTAAIIAAAGAAVLGGYSTCVEPFRIQLKELEFTFPNLPAAFDGYTILHICDFHLTKMGLLEKRAMQLIGSREVDTCIITGDVTRHPRASDIFRRVCSVIKRRDPIYMVLGNSERKPWLDPGTVVEALSFDGLEMLINSSTTLQRGRDRITLTGVDDPFSRRDDIESAFRCVDPHDFIVFLTHSPSVTPQAIEHGADLILSGHTHGGQVRLPFLRAFWTHMRANKALNDGLYPPEALEKILKKNAGHTVLFVNRGIGMSRLHVRFLCPPEVAFITLRRAPQ